MLFFVMNSITNTDMTFLDFDFVSIKSGNTVD